MVLEIFSIVVVFRMAIMGRLFPNARREWWGRMGAIVHKFSMIWIITNIAALYLLQTFKDYTTSENIQQFLVVLGGWTAIISFAVNMAYNSSGKKEKGNGFNIRDKFIRFAPYLFLIGFVLSGSYH